MSTGPALAVSAGATLGLAALLAGLGALFGAAVARRAGERRRRHELATALQRQGLDLGVADSSDAHASMVGALERGLRTARSDAAAATDSAALLRGALDTLGLAVLIVDDTGAVVARNAAADVFVAARHSDAIVEAAVGELVDGALAGAAARRTIELFGPPRRVVEVSTAPLDGIGGRAAVAVVEDVTERRRLEAVRTDFVANISHELKTPVGAIGLLAETLEAEDDPAVTERLAARIQMESLRVGRTIEDLLELSRIELGQVSVLEPVAVAEIVHEAVQRMRPAADQAGIEVVVDAVADDMVVAGERRQLISALSNLLDNSVKYSDPGSSIEVHATRHDDRVAVAVADHGIGIPARDLERVFERFLPVRPRPAAVRPVAPGWAWPSSATSPPTTTVRWRSNPVWGRAPASPSGSWPPPSPSPPPHPIPVPPPERPSGDDRCHLCARRGGRGLLRRRPHGRADP